MASIRHLFARVNRHERRQTSGKWKTGEEGVQVRFVVSGGPVLKPMSGPIKKDKRPSLTELFP